LTLLMSFSFPLHHVSIFSFLYLVPPFCFLQERIPMGPKGVWILCSGSMCNSCRDPKVIAPYTVGQMSLCACTIMQHSAWPYNLSTETCTSSDSARFEVHISNTWILFPSSDIKLIFRIFSQTLPLFRNSSLCCCG